MATLEARMRFLYLLNIAIPGALALYHLMAPAGAARALWGSGSVAPLNPPLALPMLGAWWAAIVVVSLLGLREPYKFSPVMLMQILYKFAFLGKAIIPLAMAGRWSSIPTAPVATYASYLLPLFACAPWGYWLGGAEAGRAGEPATAGTGQLKAE
ncbi:hypothetical protein ABPG75_005776 [Micractinium tetrahymenae]